MGVPPLHKEGLELTNLLTVLIYLVGEKHYLGHLHAFYKVK